MSIFSFTLRQGVPDFTDNKQVKEKQSCFTSWRIHSWERGRTAERDIVLPMSVLRFLLAPVLTRPAIFCVALSKSRCWVCVHSWIRVKTGCTLGGLAVHHSSETVNLTYSHPRLVVVLVSWTNLKPRIPAVNPPTHRWNKIIPSYTSVQFILRSSVMTHHRSELKHKEKLWALY